MVMPSTAITRYELSAPMTEFDLLMNRKGYIGPQILRPRTVALQSADLGKIPLRELLQIHKTKRAPGSGYRRGDFEFETWTYKTAEYGWEEPLDDRTLAIYHDMLDAEEIHSQRAMQFVLDEYERDVATAVHDTAVWTGADLTTALSNEWDDHENATPIDDVHSAMEKVTIKSGLVPNVLQVDTLQYWHLCQCAQILDRIKWASEATQEKMRSVIAQVLDVQRIVVAGGLKNTANEEQAASVSRIWGGEYAMVCRVAETDDPQEPCIGRTFMWSGDGPGAVGTDEELALIVEEYREEGVRGGVLRARNDRGISIMYPEAGHLLSNVLTL